MPSPVSHLAGDTARDLPDGAAATETVSLYIVQLEPSIQVVETMLQGVVRHAAHGTIIGRNTAACRILGRSRDEVLGSDPVTEGRNTIRGDGSVFHGDEHPSSVAQGRVSPATVW